MVVLKLLSFQVFCYTALQTHTISAHKTQKINQPLMRPGWVTSMDGQIRDDLAIRPEVVDLSTHFYI